MSLFDDWFLFLFSIILFFLGWLLGGSEKFWNSCEKFRYVYLAIATTCIIFLMWRCWWNFNTPKTQSREVYVYGTINAIQIWSLILSILGFAKHHLNFSNSFLRFTNQAVYPFYILHQTIIVAAGYYIVQWNIPILPKLILLVVVTFASVFLLFKYIIKPFRLTRLLYGVRIKKV